MKKPSRFLPLAFLALLVAAWQLAVSRQAVDIIPGPWAVLSGLASLVFSHYCAGVSSWVISGCGQTGQLGSRLGPFNTRNRWNVLLRDPQRPAPGSVVGIRWATDRPAERAGGYRGSRGAVCGMPQDSCFGASVAQPAFLAHSTSQIAFRNVHPQGGTGGVSWR